MNYKTWDILLVPFPFTNLRQTKKRPALIVSPEGYNSGSDVAILFITSNLKRSGQARRLSHQKLAGIWFTQTIYERDEICNH